jgi:hypothetical protein
VRPWVVAWLVGKTQATTPERETVESDKPVQGYAARQDTARSLRRYHTHGRRERSDQVGTEKLGEHQSATPRARSGRNHQRTEDDQVLGLLGRPHGYPDEHRREKPRMSTAPRNFHSAATVSSGTSTSRSLCVPACTQTGEPAETSPRETRKE